MVARGPVLWRQSMTLFPIYNYHSPLHSTAIGVWAGGGLVRPSNGQNSARMGDFGVAPSGTDTQIRQWAQNYFPWRSGQCLDFFPENCQKIRKTRQKNRGFIYNDQWPNNLMKQWWRLKLSIKYTTDYWMPQQPIYRMNDKAWCHLNDHV